MLDDERDPREKPEGQPPASEPLAEPVAEPVEPTTPAATPASGPAESEATAESDTPQNDLAPAELGDPVDIAPPTHAIAPPPTRSLGWLEERPEAVIEVPRAQLAARSRRDFLLFAAGVAASVAGAWWLLPDRAKGRLVGNAARDSLDSLAARVGLSRGAREKVLNRALDFDDDVAEALFSKGRRVRTYDRSEVTALPNNYHGRTPGPEILSGWTLGVSGLASGRTERCSATDLLGRFVLHEQVTRLVCVEGWSAIAWWGGIRFADFLAEFPPAAGARWAALRSSVSLDGRGRPEPYDVSLDLETLRHPQVLLATHLGGQPLPLAHGAPLRLLAPMKLGLKNIKALTDVEYTAAEPADYWAERGYSRYDGL